MKPCSTNITATRLEYLVSQLPVMTHYLANFVLPVRLSADPDFEIVEETLKIKTGEGIREGPHPRATGPSASGSPPS